MAYTTILKPNVDRVMLLIQSVHCTTRSWSTMRAERPQFPGLSKDEGVARRRAPSLFSFRAVLRWVGNQLEKQMWLALCFFTFSFLGVSNYAEVFLAKDEPITPNFFFLFPPVYTSLLIRMTSGLQHRMVFF